MLSGAIASELGGMVARGLAPMTATGFLKDLTQEVIQDVENHVLGVDRLRVLVGDGGGTGVVPVAFVASEVKPVRDGIRDATLYHLGGIIVGRSYQGKGLGRILVRDELTQTEADLLGFHTQSLHMLVLGHELSEYDFSLSSGLAEEMGTHNPQIQMLGHRPSVVEKGRYGDHSLYGDLGKFEKGGRVIRDLDYRHGDAVVYVGKVKQLI